MGQALALLMVSLALNSSNADGHLSTARGDPNTPLPAQAKGMAGEEQ